MTSEQNEDPFDRAAVREAEIRARTEETVHLMSWMRRNSFTGALKGVAVFALTLPLHLLIVGGSLTWSVYAHIIVLTACAIGAATSWIDLRQQPLPRRHRI